MSDAEREIGLAAESLAVTVSDGVATIVFDLVGEPVNKFNRRVKDEFSALFDRLERDESVRAAVLVSGKDDSFIAGADIEEFLELHGAADAERLSRSGQALLDRLEKLRVPVVAAIHGACLGGGLEAALACAYRIATDHPRTQLALPEVQLGLIPGAGGTQRLPRLIGLRAALEMILTGKNARARKALQLGLVDEVVHPAILREIAQRRARELAARTLRRPRGRGSLAQAAANLALDRTPFGRSIVFRKAREETQKRTRGNYPAAPAAIDAVQAGYTHDRQSALAVESRIFGEMAATDVSRQLIHLFFAGNAVKRDPGVLPPVPEPLPVHKLGVLGAGFMGAGIAGLAAQNALVVRLKDSQHERVAKGIASVRSLAEERRHKRHITRQQMDDELSLITGTVDYSGFANVDVVIEAVFEDLQVKHQVLREMERELPENAIFATNTSTIPIAAIAQASSRPDRVLGMHFFSPVHKMPLLEVIVTPRTDPQVVVTVAALGRRLGKTVVVVNDGPGFYVNRILSPYLNEAGILLDQGARVDAVDEAMLQFGFPVGPLTLVDEVGLDVASKAGAIMADAFGPRLTPARTLSNVAEAGRYGRKNRSGFYRYSESGEKGAVDETVYELVPGGGGRSEFPAEEIQERLVLAMLNEAAMCLDGGIVRSVRDGDVAAVFGIGFPPFRGGPFRYMDALGIGELVRRLEELNHRFPGRFEPAELLLNMVRRGEHFHPGGRQ